MILRFYSRLLTRLSMGWEVSRWNGISINYWRSLVAYPSIALTPLYENDLDGISAVFVYNKFCFIRRQNYFPKKKIKNNRIYSAELPIKGHEISQYPATLNVSWRTRHGICSGIVSGQTWLRREWDCSAGMDRGIWLLRSPISITADKIRKTVENLQGFFHGK